MELKLMATAAFGVEGITAEELRNMGLNNVKAENARVFFDGGFEELARVNMWLRTADRVYVILKEFKAVSFEELFENTKAFPWEDWLGENAAFPVTGKCVRSTLMSISDCQAIIKKAVVERLKQKYKVQWFKENGAKYSIVFSIVSDTVTLMLDASGAGLHRRGYRTFNTSAPLRETMAAALLILSRYDGGIPLIDPFCGSGTIPIEAYFMATDRAPGLKRAFDAYQWDQMPKQVVQDVLQEAAARYKPGLNPGIIGYDIDSSVLSIARKHASQAGISDLHFQQMDVKNLNAGKKSGMFICNPPYGERLMEVKEAEKLYKIMRSVFDKAQGWKQYIFTSHPQFERVYGKRADARRKLYNGRIECCFYQYFRV